MNFITNEQIRSLEPGYKFFSKVFIYELTVLENDGSTLKYVAEETESNRRGEEKTVILDYVKDDVYYTKP